jgi:hypothetical protein
MSDSDSQETPTSHGTPVHGLYGHLKQLPSPSPHGLQLSHGREETKKGNVPFDEADLAGIVLNSVPVSWMNQYNMTHTTLSDGTRTLLQDLELIKRVMEEKHEASLKVKAKEAAASAIAKGSSKKRSASGNPSE